MAAFARSSVPRPVRWASTAVAALALTGLFAVVRFPYDRLARALSDQSEGLVGIRLELADLGPSLWPLGIVGSDVHATWPSGANLAIPEMRLRPALSLSWLRGDPSLRVVVDGGALGQIDGELTLGARGAFDGHLEAVDLSTLPLDQLAPQLSMQGRVTADADVEIDSAGLPLGSLAFQAKDGSLSAAGLPIPIPFQTFDGDIELGGEHFARVAALALKGPMLEAEAKGSVGQAEQRGAEPLALTLDLRIRGRALQPVLQDLGIRLGPGGRAQLEITGTLSRPTFR